MAVMVLGDLDESDTALKPKTGLDSRAARQRCRLQLWANLTRDWESGDETNDPERCDYMGDTSSDNSSQAAGGEACEGRELPAGSSDKEPVRLDGAYAQTSGCVGAA